MKERDFHIFLARATSEIRIVRFRCVLCFSQGGYIELSFAKPLLTKLHRNEGFCLYRSYIQLSMSKHCFIYSRLYGHIL